MSATQKLHRCDVVRVTGRPDHLQGREAIIMGSYRDLYGGGKASEDHYSVLFVDTGGEMAWLYDQDVTLLRHGTEADIEGVREARRLREMHERDIPWIVANWPRIKDHPPGASILALAALLGLSEDDMWGKHGEGITYYTNALRLLALFADALASGDPQRVLTQAESVKAGRG